MTFLGTLYLTRIFCLFSRSNSAMNLALRMLARWSKSGGPVMSDGTRASPISDSKAL